MDSNLAKLMNLRVKKTMDSLQKNNMNAFYIPSKNEVVPFLKTVLVPGEKTGAGGSVTLVETGVIELLKSGSYVFADRSDPSLSEEQKAEIPRQYLLADTFFSSTNAVTETGILYNVDGNSNRVSAILFGPKRVFIIAGINKIVKTVEEAVIRVKTTAAPANCIRLDRDTFCAGNGSCVRSCCDRDALMTLPPGCCRDTICCNYVISGFQRQKGRINVIIVGEPLGY